MKRVLFFNLIIIAFVFFPSCNDAQQQNKLAEKFFRAYNTADSTVIASIAYETIAQDLKNFIKTTKSSYGKITEYKKYYSAISRINGKKEKRVYYKINFENKKTPLYMFFEIIKNKNNIKKISAYYYSDNKEQIDSIYSYTNQANRLVKDVFDIRKKGNWNRLALLLDTSKISVNAFTNLLIQVDSVLGPVQAYTIKQIRPIIDRNGKIYIYVISKINSNNNEIYYEKYGIERYKSQAKLTYYKVNQSYKKILE